MIAQTAIYQCTSFFIFIFQLQYKISLVALFVCFGPCCKACEIIVPWPPSCIGSAVLTTDHREVPGSFFNKTSEAFLETNQHVFTNNLSKHLIVFIPVECTKMPLCFTDTHLRYRSTYDNENIIQFSNCQMPLICKWLLIKQYKACQNFI